MSRPHTLFPRPFIRQFTTPQAPPPVSQRTKPYLSALQAISARTGTPLSSLIVSFAILHEVTAIIPLVGVFFGARALGVGERVVEMMKERGEGGWVEAKWKVWMEEGEAWAGRVGRRYGIFGFEKGEKIGRDVQLAGDVANAVLAYGVGKAILPLRIGFSLYLSPVFSRRVVEPVRVGVMRLWPR
ncbi:hypothetical protein RhiJN_27371 [Ceratobasidium sp. AG-Ba]|nr:hypothetical protein RhiJN_13289 [Ceratobasidium sp. AG-Ba]QRV99352.1 hypothetical protein RhiJN_27371 [Ceratobasidium sp. AG-Ba]QRW13857.1 hypothetical protein RhiLY_12856 [Ceratobasidium sp. AG-Ba]